jgi:hypothetical protein
MLKNSLVQEYTSDYFILCRNIVYSVQPYNKKSPVISITLPLCWLSQYSDGWKVLEDPRSGIMGREEFYHTIIFEY